MVVNPCARACAQRSAVPSGDQVDHGPSNSFSQNWSRSRRCGPSSYVCSGPEALGHELDVAALVALGYVGYTAESAETGRPNRRRYSRLAYAAIEGESTPPLSETASRPVSIRATACARLEPLGGLDRGDRRGLQQPLGIPVRRCLQGVEVGGEQRRRHQSAYAAEGARARLVELPVEERLDRVEVGLRGDVGAAEHLLRLGGDVEGVGFPAVEERLQPYVVAEGPEPHAVRDDAGVGSAEEVGRPRADRPRRGEHNLRRRGGSLRIRAEPGGKLARVVERPGEGDGERVVGCERRLAAPVQVADAERAGAERRDDRPVPPVRGGREHPFDAPGGRRLGWRQDRG